MIKCLVIAEIDFHKMEGICDSQNYFLISRFHWWCLQGQMVFCSNRKNWSWPCLSQISLVSDFPVYDLCFLWFGVSLAWWQRLQEEVSPGHDLYIICSFSESKAQNSNRKTQMWSLHCVTDAKWIALDSRWWSRRKNDYIRK